MVQATGNGQFSPEDAASDFNVHDFLIGQAIGRISTAKLVQVKALHAGTPPTVDVQPLVNQLDGKANQTPWPTIFGIPVFRLQAGNFAVIVDPMVGDIGVMVCCDRDISSVKNSKTAANPGSFRRFDAADGIYLGAVLGAVPTSFVQFTSSGFTITDAAGNKIQSSSTGMTLFDVIGNQIQMKAGGVNIVVGAGRLSVNSVNVTVP